MARNITGMTSNASITPMTHTSLQRKCACGCGTGLSGECEDCRQKRLGFVQRLAVNASPMPSAPAIVNDVLRSPGIPLDLETRDFMEPRFGHDFSHVRIHTDSRAAESARAVNALAYTVGRDVVFGAGQYTPATREGLKLVAHELTHVRQQRISHDHGGKIISEPSGTIYEQEADRVSTELINTGNVSSVALQMNTPSLQRQETGTTVEVTEEAEPVTRRRESARRRRAPAHADAELESFQLFEREHPREARQADRLDSAFGQVVDHLDIILSGYDLFERAATHPILTRYQGALRTAGTRRQRMAAAGFTASRVYDWVNSLRNTLTAMGRVLTALEHEVSDDPDIQEVRTERTTAANLSMEILGLSFVQEGRREREDESDETAPAERDVDHETTEALRRYVRRNRTSIRERASLHVGSIRDILTRHLGRDRATLTGFLERLRVSEPELAEAVSLEGDLERALSERTFIDEADDELREYVEQHRPEIESDPDSQISPIMGILHSHLGWNPTVIREYLDRLQTIDTGLYNAVSLGGRTLAEFVAREERPILPSVGRALLHGVMGEWHPETDTTGMSEAEREEAEAEDITSIGVSTIIGLVPGLDQASDARDLTAHTYFMITREGEISSPLRWIGLVFSLIGAIPEVGTAIKGLSQILMRGVSRHGYHVVARIYNLIDELLPGAIDALIDMRRGLAARWTGWVTRGRGIWSDFLTRGRTVLQALIDLTTERFNRLQEFTSRMMPEAFTRARTLFEESFDAVTTAARRVGTEIAEGIPQFLDGVRRRFVSLSSTGRLRLEVERLDNLERLAREAFERGDVPTAERLARELDELVTGAEHQVDELSTIPPEHVSSPEVRRTTEVAPRASTETPRSATETPTRMESPVSETRPPSTESPTPPRHTSPDIEEWPDGLVHHGLDERQAQASYMASLQEDPGREAGIWMDMESGEYIVVQGNQRFVTSEWFSDPEFASRRWVAVEHFHPGSDLGARFASTSDFEHMMYNQLHGIERPGAVETTIRWRDPASGNLVATDIGFDPTRSDPYWIRYLDAEGNEQVRYFADVPWNPGSDYREFMRAQGIPLESVPTRVPGMGSPVSSSTPVLDVPTEIDEAVEGAIVEDPSQYLARRRGRLPSPLVTGRAESAREVFDTLRAGHASSLGLRSGGQVHHAIELQVLDRYPDVFTASELNDLANMRGVPSEFYEYEFVEHQLAPAYELGQWDQIDELEGRLAAASPSLSNPAQLHQSLIRRLWNDVYHRINAEISERGLQVGTEAYRTYIREALTQARDGIDEQVGIFFSEQRRILFEGTAI